jgi:hypothetical protein
MTDVRLFPTLEAYEFEHFCGRLVAIVFTNAADF